MTNVYTFPPNDGLTNTTDELGTLKATQTLENKTLVSPTFTGSLSIESFVASGNATLGSDSTDSLTVNAGTQFASSATFSNSLIINQGMTVTGDMIMNSHIDMVDDKEIKLGDDDDLVIKHYTSGVSMLKNTGSVLGIYSDVMLLSNADVSINFASFSASASVIKHVGTDRITTTTTGITIGGAIDAVTSITGSGDITIATDKFTLDSANGNAVFGGNITGGGDITATSGTTFQLGSSASAKLGIGRAASTYNLEVEGSIYSTGSTIIAGNGTAGKFIVQKGAAGIGLHFTDNTGTDQAVLDSGGNFGIGKDPAYKLDVSGNSWIDGDLTVNTTNPAAGTGGKISAREIVLTDNQTGSTATLNAATSAGVSRARVFFQSN